MRRNIRVALAVIVFLLGGIVVWATTTEISGAVIAPATSSSIPMPRRCSTRREAS